MQVNSDKHFLQKLSSVLSIFCFVCAVLSGLVLAIYHDELTKVYVASFAASAFFFCSVGMVLNVIAWTNLPKIKVENPED